MAKTFKNAYLFDYLRNILTDKSEVQFKKDIADPDFHVSYSVYMVTNYLSMSKSKDIQDFIMENQLQLEKLPQRQHYRLLLDCIPRQRSSFIQYLR